MCGRSWATGWLEGEGSFLARKHREGQWECGLQGTSTDEDVLMKVRRVLGGKIYGPYRPKNPKHKPVVRWTLYSQAGLLKLLPKMRQHLGRRRRKQVNLMLEVLRRLRHRKGWLPSVA